MRRNYHDQKQQTHLLSSAFLLKLCTLFAQNLHTKRNRQRPSDVSRRRAILSCYFSRIYQVGYHIYLLCIIIRLVLICSCVRACVCVSFTLLLCLLPFMLAWKCRKFKRKRDRQQNKLAMHTQTEREPRRSNKIFVYRMVKAHEMCIYCVQQNKT